MASQPTLRTYRDFTIALAPYPGEEEPTRFQVQLQDTSDLQLGTAQPFRLPITTDLLGRRLREVEDEIGTCDGSAEQSPRELGAELFDALFVGAARESLSNALHDIHPDSDTGLRLRVLIDPERPGGRTLSALPWELLYRTERREKLGLSTLTPIVRQLPVPLVRNLPLLDGPLRVAVVVASPRNHQPLALADEKTRIERICHANSNLEVEVLASGTHDTLREALRSGRFHGFHFMGHGRIDQQTGAGCLVFEDEDRDGDLVPGDALAETVRDCSGIRFAVLNACDSGHLPRHKGQDPYSGVGTALMMAGLPAVVAMQFPISDQAALVFSETFYKSLAEGAPIESAVTEGRLAISRRFRGSFEWATPALYLGKGGGKIVVRSEAAQTVAEPEPPPASTASKYSVDARDGKGTVIGDGTHIGSMSFGDD